MFVVRVVLHNEEVPLNDTLEGPFLECLRHAGLIKIHRDDEDGRCFDILPPRDVKSRNQSAIWAQQTADRMTSFGFNAVKAPEWRE